MRWRGKGRRSHPGEHRDYQVTHLFDMVGLFLSFLHPPGSSSLPSEGWPAAEVRETLEVPRSWGFLWREGQGQSTACRLGQGKAQRGGLPCRHPPRGADTDWGSLALVAAWDSGTSLLPLERLQVALATGTLRLRLRSACSRFPFPWQLQGRAWLGTGAGQVLQLLESGAASGFEVHLIRVPAVSLPRVLGTDLPDSRP